MPEEIFILAMTAIIAGTVVVATLIKSITGYHRSKLDQAKGEGSSLTTSELHQLMRRAVAEATQPLVEKIEDLELRLGAAEEGIPHERRLAVDFGDEDEDVHDAHRTMGRRRGARPHTAGGTE